MSPRLLSRTHRTLLALAVVVLLGGCARSQEPRLEAWENGAYRPRAIRSSDVTGRRAGATTTAVAMVTLDDGRTLRVDLVIEYNPTPVLGSGHWQLDGPGGGSGEVRAESIKFLGGQGEGPSFGGRLRLEANGSPRFRLTLPVRPLTLGSGMP
jgi:hypothetical protein